MFPITCNAIGDIIAVVQLIRDIAVALNDVRGAAEEYRQFTRVLTALGTVMAEVYGLTLASHNETLKQAVLEEVQLCCADINNAHNSISGFEVLEETSLGHKRNATQRALKKIQWHLLRASDVAKYAQRFGESHERLNSFVSLLGHQSTSHLLDEQCSDIVAVHRHHLQLAQDQRRALRESVEEIKAAALLALRESAVQSRQHIIEQTLSRPFFAAPDDRRVASRVQRVADLIFDSLAPDTPRDQRDRFLSLLAPFLVAGAAFVVHSNVGSQWRTTGLWSAICALVVQVLWLQSSTPMHPGFTHGNGVFLIGLLGEEITVPNHFCSSYEYFHEFLKLFYSKISGAVNFVPYKRYELFQTGTSRLISASNWAACMQPGICMEMGLLDISHLRGDVFYCPYCYCKYNTRLISNEIVCNGCSRRFHQTLQDFEVLKVACMNAAATIIARRHDTDWNSALFQMDAPITASTTTAQHTDYVNLDGAISFARICHRVHVANFRPIFDYTSDQLQSASQQVVDALLSDQTIFPRSTLVYELFRAHIRSPHHANPKLPAYKHNLRSVMSVYKTALAELEHGAAIGDTRDGTVFNKPMTVVEQLLVEMVSALDIFVNEPSEENIRRWEDILRDYSDEYLSLDERTELQEIVNDHQHLSRNLRRGFGFA
ncbi:unnamed protein product [Peniophora sp. CBMAI 1063]|nr:unnamed protein product [Peniophora sp. CBMAI 1063]